MTDGAENPTRRETISWVVVVIAVLTGIAASIVLMINHISFALGRGLFGACDIGLRLNCAGVLLSDHAKFLGQPVPIWSVSFFSGLLFLAFRAGRRRSEYDPSWALLVLLLSGGLAYSLFLLGVMVFDIGVYCPYCLALDAASVVGLSAALTATGAKGLSGLLRSMRKAVTSKSALSFSIVFGGVALSGMTVVDRKLDVFTDVHVENAYELVEGYPNLIRVNVDGSEDAPRLGPDDAPVVIVELSDFECPFCARFNNVLHDLLEQYPDQLQIRFMHFPLSTACNGHAEHDLHPHACEAARAAVCAREQGEFWAMHDLLFAYQTHLEREDTVDFAQRLNLDLEAFERCIDDDRSLETVRADIEAGQAARVAAGSDRVSAPFFFVNGLHVRGARSRQAVEVLILRELQELGSATRDGSAETD